MTLEERDEVKRAISFYEERGWDWSDVVEYLIRRAHGRLPWQEQPPGRRPGRPRKERT